MDDYKAELRYHYAEMEMVIMHAATRLGYTLMLTLVDTKTWSSRTFVFLLIHSISTFVLIHWIQDYHKKRTMLSELQFEHEHYKQLTTQEMERRQMEIEVSTRKTLFGGEDFCH